MSLSHIPSLARTALDHLTNGSSTDPQTEQRLPIECVVNIAQFLAGAYQYGALARLNQTSRKIQQETESVLFETLLWDTDAKPWILHGGRIPRGWRHTKFLVIQESSLQGLSQYISSITGAHSADNLLSIFPELTMVISKHPYQPVKHKDESETVHMSVTLYRSVTSSTLFIAPVTGTKLRQTTFFNASVQGWTDHEATHPAWDEQIASLILRKGTCIKRGNGSSLPWAHDWRGSHSADPDFELSLQVEDAPWPLSSERQGYELDVTEIAQTLQEVFRLVPARNLDETDLYHFRIDCRQDVLGVLMKLLPNLLCDGIKLVIHVVDDDDDDENYQVHHLRQHLQSFARIYMSIWKQLGAVEPDTTFFRIEYVENAEEGDKVDGAQPDGQSDSSRENLVVGTLSTLPAPAVNGHGVPGIGFESTITRINYEDDSDWEEDDAAQQVLFKKQYHIDTRHDV